MGPRRGAHRGAARGDRALTGGRARWWAAVALIVAASVLPLVQEGVAWFDQAAGVAAERRVRVLPAGGR